MLWKKKPKEIIQNEYYFRYNSIGQKKYEQTEKETQFLDSFMNTLSETEKRKVHLTRMSNGTISVDYKSYPIGKIKLTGRKYYMQILKGLYKVDVLDGDVELFIEHIPDWCRYIRRYCKD